MPHRPVHASLSAALLVLVSACASPYSDSPLDPPFGQTVRQALQAQQLQPAPSKAAQGVPYYELENALERQQKAKPPELPQNRSTQGGASLTGM